MTAYETRSHIGPDGKLVLSVPREYANLDVRVLVEPTTDRNGTLPAGTRMPDRTFTRDEWRLRLKQSAGSLPEFPDVERPGPNTFEDRGDWT